ncbi:MAG: n-acetylglutamate synthase [Phycisphaerae bacterium]|nr:n-acetylglutamate synthase [Saprospiraceae bacterium]
MNYHGKNFRSIANSPNGEVSGDTLFHYEQTGKIVTASYSGGGIVQGHLIALADEQGCLAMRYHHVNVQGELQTGTCQSVPEILPDGRIRLHETWRWTSGDGSSGSSMVEEC